MNANIQRPTIKYLEYQTSNIKHQISRFERQPFKKENVEHSAFCHINLAEKSAPQAKLLHKLYAASIDRVYTVRRGGAR